jgi:signal transduction histidine kinase
MIVGNSSLTIGGPMAGAGSVVGVRVVPDAAAAGRHRTPALTLSGVTCVIAMASMVLAVVNLGSDTPAFEVHTEFYVIDLALALLYAPFGALVVARSGHVIGWALQLIALGFGVTAFGLQYASLGVEHPDAPAYEAVTQLVVAGWVVGALTGLLVVPWLIGRRAPSGPRLLAAVVGTVVAVGAGVSRYLIQIDDAPRNPLTGGTWVADVAYDYDSWAIPVYFLGGLVGAVHLAIRAFRAGPEERRGLLWVMVSVLMLALAYLAFEVGLTLEGPLLGVGAASLCAAQVMLPAAIFVLVIRHPSWNVDLAISRAVVGALLTAAVLAAYIVLVWAGGRVLPTGRDSAALIAVAVLALGVMPVRAWLQRRVERLVFGSTSDAGELLDRLGSDVGAGGDDRSILEGLVEGLRRSLRLSRVAVESTAGEPVVAAGREGTAPVAVPLRSRGRDVGVLRLSAPPGERLDLRTVRLVEQISGLVAVALDLALVNTDLERARSRLLDVRQEERRLLRRELHDGLGPSLAGVALALAAIDKTSTLVPDDAELLSQLQDELSRRADDVRQMARVLLPPALEDGRLGDALEVLAGRFSQSRFVVSVRADEPDRIDSSRQVALYHIAAEGVLNAFRHAGAHRCRIELDRLPDGAVRLSVADDGIGGLDAATPGIGLASMRERTAELGGSFAIDSSEKGATVTVVLP